MNHDRPWRSIDWPNIYQRLAKAEEAIMRGQSQTPEARRTALEARARALAAEPANPNRGPGMEVVEFLLGSSHYAVPASSVREVRPLQELTPLPCTPAFVSGIMMIALSLRLRSWGRMHPSHGPRAVPAPA